MGKLRFAKHTQRFADLPHEPCVYVAELSTGVVKVGCSTSARARLMALASEVKREHGAELQRFQVFVRKSYKAAFEAETKVVYLFREVAKAVAGRREFFTGISYSKAKAIASEALSA